MHIQDATYHLDNYQLKPTNRTENNIFNHMIKFFKSNNKSDNKPSIHFNVEITEGQEGILNPYANNMVVGRLLNDDGGKRARINIT